MRITGKIFFSYPIGYKSCASVIVEIIIQPGNPGLYFLTIAFPAVK